MAKRIGVLFAGCGAWDGTDPMEAILALLAIERAGGRAEPLAARRMQLDVVDHATAQVSEAAARDLFSESCRLSRTRVTPLDEARFAALDALLLPGGFGAPKNCMSGFAQPGTARRLHPEEERLLRHFMEARKPVGSISLGRALVAAASGESLGPEPLALAATEVEADEARRFYYTPGFLVTDRIAEVAAGVEKLVSRLVA